MSEDVHRRGLEIFEAALDLPEAERWAFAIRACEGDEALEAEVLGLLEHHDPRTIIRRPRESPTRTILSLMRPRFRLASAGSRVPEEVRRSVRRAGISSLVLAVLIVVIGAWSLHRVRVGVREGVRHALEPSLAAKVSAIEEWFRAERQTLESLVSRSSVVESVAETVRLKNSGPTTLEDLRGTGAFADLRDSIGDYLDDEEVLAVSIVGPRVGATLDVYFTTIEKDLEGMPLSAAGLRRFMEIPGAEGPGRTTLPFFEGSVAFRPYREGENVEIDPSETDARSVILIGAPIRREGGVLALAIAQLDATGEFSRILNEVTPGDSVETFAFDDKGLLLSESRFDDQLRDIGLLEESAPSSALHLRLRDPGVNLVRRRAAKGMPDEWPLTRMAASAVQRADGIDLDGYRDYRGVRVVGAWRWLGKYDLGIATEMDYAEAYAPLRIVRGGFLLLLGATVVLWASVTFSLLWNARLRREVLVAQELGQYTLIEQIGEGGMGKVFRARHAMLRRPTAVKLLDGRDATQDAVQRFEREVQLVSKLSHPNTIQVYDYGRTPEGVFYYAMELLPGLTIGQVVRRSGGQDPRRVVHILLQVCGSLAEAHERGLTHRDIKPANIMLCERGGMLDVVKVLDFGLSRSRVAEAETEVTSPELLGGTPLYIAPERIRSPSELDPRTDLYSLGAVAFLLLTGESLFEGAGAMELLHAALHDQPRRVSDVRPDVPRELDDLVASCLSKDPDGRPASAAAMTEMLHAMGVGAWTQSDARAWWDAHGREFMTAD